MTTTWAILAAIKTKFRNRKAPKAAPVSPAPWAGHIPPYVLPTVRLPQRTPGMALVRERVAASMTGLIPHTSHRAPEHIIRVRPGWVVADITAEFTAITARLVEVS